MRDSETQCDNVVFDHVYGRVICESDGTILLEHMIDDDLDFSRVILPSHYYAKIQRYPYLKNNL